MNSNNKSSIKAINILLNGVDKHIQNIERRIIVRLDKFLKVSRVIKRRTVANDAADNGRVSVNGKVVKPSYEVKVGDIVEIQFGDKLSRFQIIEIPKVQGKDMGELIKLL